MLHLTHGCALQFCTSVTIIIQEAICDRKDSGVESQLNQFKNLNELERHFPHFRHELERHLARVANVSHSM